jgi:hypothetical protein
MPNTLYLNKWYLDGVRKAKWPVLNAQRIRRAADPSVFKSVKLGFQKMTEWAQGYLDHDSDNQPPSMAQGLMTYEGTIMHEVRPLLMCLDGPRFS